MPHNKALQLTRNSAFQSKFSSLLASTAGARAASEALLAAAERLIRWTAWMRRLDRALGILAALTLLAPTVANADSLGVEVASATSERFVLRESPSGDELLLTRGRQDPVVVGSCSEEQAGEAQSLRAGAQGVVVYRNCGATVEYSTLVVISRGDQRATAAAFLGRQPLKLGRDADQALSVRTPQLPDDMVFRKDRQALGVSLVYSTGAELVRAPESEYLDFSSFNFGATGRAAGMPAELLLRVAGWSQLASGLARDEWGRWNRSAPYGDDPRGAAQVANGIAYFESRER